MVLNRAHVYASSRERLRLTWKARLFLRLAPLLLLCYQTLRLLQALRCQTGFQLPELRFKDTGALINRTWVGSDKVIYGLVSRLIFWEEVQDSCRAVNMIPLDEDGPALWQGSTSLLWPLFLTLAFSQFVETVSSALRGRQPRPETGMTMFEHSMAFAEAETITRTAVGLGLSLGYATSPSSPPQADPSPPVASASKAAATGISMTKSMLLTRLNVPPEVLLISLISAASHIANHTLGILGLQSRFRLANTTVWGLLYLSLFVYSFSNYAQSANMQEMQKIRYPTVCIIGYLPHLLISIGISVCAFIYVCAIICTLLSPPTHWGPLSFWEKIKMAHDNMSASVSISNIRIRSTEDFYTVLLKAGYQVMSAATEAVYFNEGLQVTLHSETWLDKARVSSNAPASHHVSQVPLELQEGFTGGEGFGLTDEMPQASPDGVVLSTGYAVERKTLQKLNKTSTAALKEEGVGIAQRSGRWFISWTLMEQISRLMGLCMARFTVSMMENLGAVQPPQWLLRLARLHSNPEAPADPQSSKHALDFWLISDIGEMSLPQDRNVDVEAEAKKRLRLGDTVAAASELDSMLYSWWKGNGWWGDVDNSGDYHPDAYAEQDDTTSMISESTAWESDSSDSGASTPTATTAYASGVDTHDGMADLARLLDPRTIADKQEARMLAQRLRPDAVDSGTMTRAKYRQRLLRDRAPTSLSAPDEELVLSSLISTRRTRSATAAAAANDGADTQRAGLAWDQGGDGMGSAGPQCAICHCAPRTVLVWPCRCLSLCEECRMHLAVNNFSKCVCCRRDVVAFSRLFVP